VRIPQGRVAAVDTVFDVAAWRGIPFAAAPVGALRWRAPQPPPSWRHVRQSSAAYTPCVQAVTTQFWVPTGRVTGSEDCLYLDVYRPRTSRGPLPVIVWIHGGANVSGSAAESHWNEALPAQIDAVLVVIQYRLNAFGFFPQPWLNPGAGPAERSGNFGVLDQLQALRWVQENVAAFGGDPGNVTIAGESAGGLNVLNLVGSPLARGLFHRAVAESPGSTNAPPELGVAAITANLEKLLVADGTCADRAAAAALRQTMSSAQIEAYLRSKPAEQIISVMLDGLRGNGIESVAPVIDGTVILGTPAQVFQSGSYNHVPVLLGTNEYEDKPFLPLILGPYIPVAPGYTWDNVYNVIGGAQPPMTLDQIMPDDPAGPPYRALYEDVGRLASLNWKAAMVDSLARSMTANGDRVYAYWFKWGGVGSGAAPFDFLVGSGHASELPFVFGWPWPLWPGMFTEANQPGRIALQKTVMGYVGAFARSGDPNAGTASMPRWASWSNDEGGPKSMILDADLAQARVGMTSQEVTLAGVAAQIAELPDWQQPLVWAFYWY
jgi:para-nitrobenzyl esterase